MKIKEYASLAAHNTFHIDVRTRYLIDVETPDDIVSLIHSTHFSPHPKLILGAGSNILFTHDFEGCTIRPLIKGIKIIKETNDNVVLKVGAGERWDTFVQYCVEKGFGGLENLSLIPGTVGACPIQNIGAYGKEVKEVIVSVDAIDLLSGNKKRYNNKECQFSYRSSIFKSMLKNSIIITYVIFNLDKHAHYTLHYKGLKAEISKYDSPTFQNIRDAVITIRRRKLPDPEVLGNAGSFFKNPVTDRQQLDGILKLWPACPFFEDADGNIKLSAAWMIEQAGFKGYKENDVGTFQLQPLVIVNYGRASGKEVLLFAQKIHQGVFEKFGIDLEMEVNIV